MNTDFLKEHLLSHFYGDLVNVILGYLELIARIEHTILVSKCRSDIFTVDESGIYIYEHDKKMIVVYRNGTGEVVRNILLVTDYFVDRMRVSGNNLYLDSSFRGKFVVQVIDKYSGSLIKYVQCGVGSNDYMFAVIENTIFYYDKIGLIKSFTDGKCEVISVGERIVNVVATREQIYVLTFSAIHEFSGNKKRSIACNIEFIFVLGKKLYGVADETVYYVDFNTGKIVLLCTLDFRFDVSIKGIEVHGNTIYSVGFYLLDAHKYDIYV